HGFTLELSQGTLMKMDGGENNSVTGCTFRNAGGTALKGSGTNHLVFGCHIHDMGVGGVYLSGGDRETLKPGYHAIVNNTIHHYGRITRTYSQAVEISGVGNYVGNNKISDAPHMAISFSGNDELMEYNEIDNVCCDSNDAGAIYSGRNWTMRGNLLRYNYLHDISGFRGEGCVGMYLDDMFSSADMVGNLFVNVTRAMLIGGGRDNHVYNNVFIDCQPALHIDSRALDWCSDHADSWIQENEEKGTISGIKWNQPPYRDRYPELASIFDPGKTPKAPEGNVISRNVCYQTNGDYSNTHWIQKEARPYLRIEDNIIGEDPGFVDAEHGDYHFKPGSPALKAGIPSVPYEKAGTFPHPLSVK
ncbi:MAG: right-handed parallel beta-helix repeat-containing protein, partial [Thermoguttaceae bacterium]|nr:right-handed parallel beta-helix repeat-containing protein [Thermoguttaceae bacterium]